LLTRGIPPDLEWEANHLRRGQSVSWRKGDVIVQAWKDKRLVQIRSTINYMTIVTTERKERKTNLEVKKSNVVFQYNKFIKGIERADRYPSYYSVLRKSVKWPNVSAKFFSEFLCTKQ
jgi:hypothetical protein